MELMTGQFMVTSWEALFEYHNLVAQGVKAKLGARAPLIGGMTFGLHDLNMPDQPRHDADYLRKYIPTKAAADFYEAAGTTKWPRTGLVWEQWDKIWKNYIDTCGASTDFYSIHLYDWPSWKGSDPATGGHVRTGGHVEALLDMVEWYDVYTHGRRKPVIVSEYGATSGAFQKLEGLDRLRMSWELTKPMSGAEMHAFVVSAELTKTVRFV
jgi:agarase